MKNDESKEELKIKKNQGIHNLTLCHLQEKDKQKFIIFIIKNNIH